MINSDNPGLLLIDIQKGLDELEYWGGERNNLHAEENMALLLHFWRTHHLPLFHIQHCSTNPNSPLVEGKIGNEIKEIVKPLAEEPILKKNVNSAFIGTNLQERLAQQNINTLVIIGLTTDHCVSTTTRMAGNLGFDTYLISDATATFNKKGIQGEHYSAELIHLTTLASLNEEFATVLTTEQLIKELIERF